MPAFRLRQGREQSPAARRATPRALALSALWLALFAADAAAAASFVMLDGSRTRGEPIALNDAGQLQLKGGQTLDLGSVWRIDRRGVQAADRPPDGTAALLRLTDGSALHVTKLAIDRGRVVFDWQGGRASQLPLGQVRAIRFDLTTGEDAVDPGAFLAARDADRANRDALFIEQEGKLLSVDGVLEQVTGEKIRFRFNDESRSIDRAKVFGLTLALTAAPPETTGWAAAQLDDGSRLWGRLSGFDGKTLTLRRGDQNAINLDWANVARVDFNSPRLQFLDEMDPDRQRTRAIVTYPWSMQRRLNVMGRTMRLGDRTYNRGLGVHAASELSYRLDGGYERFVATIGIDASTAEQGDCVFRVDGDGRTLLSERVRGEDPPKTITVDIAGVERLTLAVDPGENLDIGDRANWANARLIRRGD